MPARVQDPAALRATHAPRVTFVELFFDLVFVFAVTQLSHTLVGHSDAASARCRRCSCCWPCGGCWMYTCWFTNWVDPDQARRCAR